MKKELYQKVYIKDQSDLPTEDGVYFVAKKYNLKSAGVKPMIYTVISKKIWLKDIAWYLQPIESPLPEISDEDILNLLDYLVKFIKRTR